MAITTYSELKTALANWPSRTNQAGWSDRVPEFIALAEDYLNAELPLRVFQIETTLTATASSKSVALPTDYLEPYGLWHVSTPYEELTGRVASDLPYYPVNGRPTQWAISAANIIFERPCDTAYQFRFFYRMRLALSDAAPANWLLTNHPRAYLYAALFEAAAFIDDGSDYLSKMQAMRNEAMSSASRLAGRSKKIGKLRADDALMVIGRANWPHRLEMS